MQFENAQQSLEEREILLEKRIDQLAEVDRALELAAHRATQERDRANRIGERLEDLMRKLRVANIDPALNINNIK
ncbi:hypothetical protein, partial [Pseudomonas sp. CHM02]|uniref:hypothetical protein n=1 Tax=Pseudomonas sp. CHM02 TaxID=1463662 RepID=UPI003526DBE5